MHKTVLGHPRTARIADRAVRMLACSAGAQAQTARMAALLLKEYNCEYRFYAPFSPLCGRFQFFVQVQRENCHQNRTHENDSFHGENAFQYAGLHQHCRDVNSCV